MLNYYYYYYIYIYIYTIFSVTKQCCIHLWSQHVIYYVAAGQALAHFLPVPPAYCSLPSAAQGVPFHAQKQFLITRPGHGISLVSRIIIQVLAAGGENPETVQGEVRG